MEHKGNSKLYMVIACWVYKGAVRFSINTTAFKKSRLIISPINNQEYFDRGSWSLNHKIPTGLKGNTVQSVQTMQVYNWTHYIRLYSHTWRLLSFDLCHVL